MWSFSSSLTTSSARALLWVWSPLRALPFCLSAGFVSRMTSAQSGGGQTRQVYVWAMVLSACDIQHSPTQPWRSLFQGYQHSLARFFFFHLHFAVKQTFLVCPLGCVTSGLVFLPVLSICLSIKLLTFTLEAHSSLLPVVFPLFICYWCIRISVHLGWT